MLREHMKKIMATPDTDYRSRADKQITEYILTSELYRKARTVFTFITMANEIDTAAVIDDAIEQGKILCGPKCFRDKHMEARRISGLNDVISGLWDVPAPADSCPVIEKEEIDLVLIPCLAGNTKGYRVGYGAGYYDRYLRTYTGTTLLLCRERQLVREIPTESHDIAAEYYVTEQGLFRAGK